MIPEVLKERGFRYILLKPKEKIPLENWKENNYEYDNNILIKHLGVGGNYGLICGNGIIVIDADTKELNDIVKSKFPKTFTVKTNKGKHYYYYSIDFLKKESIKKQI